MTNRQSSGSPGTIGNRWDTHMEIRDADFEECVLQADRPVLVDFWASWCPPCKMMQPVVDRLSTKVADWADVYSINIDRSPDLAGKYQISGVPTFISFAGGQPVERRTGALTEGQLIALLDKACDAIPPVSAGTVSSDNDATTANYVTVVSGLPRSGTSMMMRMLAAGGIAPLTDELRTADADNPNGYYEFEDVKSIADETSWLERAAGASVKMVYSLLKHLPTDREYRVIFMRRHVDEILQSQKKMLERNGISTNIPDAQMRALFDRELRQFYAWLPQQSHLKLINVSYNDLLADPTAMITQINRHLDGRLNTEAMLQTVDPTLYRHRAA
ncbi:MAG: thioredoxin [Planctomycetaceae bacterium]|nr:thioredoxin [Planctomycetaceae bacterium]